MNFKKLLFTFLLAFACVFAFACEKDDKKEDGKDVEKELQQILDGIVLDSSYNKLTSDFKLPRFANGEYFIEWTIDEKYAEFAAIGEKDGEQFIDVIRPEADQDFYEFEFAATISKGLYTASRTWTGYIEPKDASIQGTQIADLFDLAQGAKASISGVVTYTTGTGFWVKDDSGCAFVYTTGFMCKEGDEVEVSGTKDLYYALMELKDVTIEITKEGNGAYDYTGSVIESTVVTLSDYQTNSKDSDGKYTKEGIAPLGKFYKASGKVVKDPNGKYTYALLDEEANKHVVLYDSGMKTGVKDSLAAFEGKYVEMVVLYYDYYSTGFGRVIPIANTIKEVSAPEVSDEAKVNNVLSQIESAMQAKITEDIELVKESEYAGLTITWESSNEAVLTKDGKVGTSSNNEETVKLTVTVKLGAVEEKKEFEVVVVFSVGDVEYDEISKVQSLENNAEVTVKGMVTYVYKDGFYVKDATASIYVYLGSGKTPTVKVGEVVSVSGKKGNYNGPQIANPEVVKLEDGTFTYTAESKTMEEIAALTDELALFGQVYKTTFVVTPSGTYINAGYGTEGKTLMLYNTDEVVNELNKYANKTIEADVMLYAYKGSWRLFVIASTIVEK